MWIDHLTDLKPLAKTAFIFSLMFNVGCSSIQFRDGSLLNNGKAETSSRQSPQLAEDQAQSTQGRGVATPLVVDGLKIPQHQNLKPNPYLGSSKLSRAQRASQAEYLKQTYRMIQNKDFSQAERLLKDTSQLQPTSGVAYQLGLLELARNEPQKALAYFKQAITMNEKNVHAYNQVALIYRADGQFLQAKNYYTQAINIWPGYLAAWYNLGILEDLYLGNKQAALTAYTQYLAYAKMQSETPKEYKSVELWVKDLSRNP